MVVLNFTLIVELVLFLTFLWGITVLIIRPMLKTMDDRETSITENLSTAESDDADAEGLEKRYARELAGARRAANQDFRDARRVALDKHAAQLADKRRQADNTVLLLRKQAMAKIEEDRPAFRKLVPDLANLFAKQLGIGRDSS